MIVSGGQHMTTFQCVIRYRPRSSARFITAAIGFAASPDPLNGTSGSRVSRFLTSSRPQKHPRPRTSPIDGCFSASFASSTRNTSPIAAAFSTMPSSWNASIDATADAHASGCPL